MNGKGTGITLATIGVVLGLVTAHGKAVIEMLQALPLVAQTFADKLPLGLWSWTVAALAAGFVRWVAARASERASGPQHDHGFRNDMVAIAVGSLVVLAQTILTPGIGAAGLLQAAMLGPLGGWAGVFIGRAVTAGTRRMGW